MNAAVANDNEATGRRNLIMHLMSSGTLIYAIEDFVVLLYGSTDNIGRTTKPNPTDIYRRHQILELLNTGRTSFE
ncbi:hypothetical protein PI125_g9544 [Phytophthora idaei]|nr:hypothetical protein PI125_g9544 [Phytophthora idaei]